VRTIGTEPQAATYLLIEGADNHEASLMLLPPYGMMSWTIRKCKAVAGDVVSPLL